MEIKVSTSKQFFYTLKTNFNKTYEKVYFIFCDNTHVIPVFNNGMDRVSNPIEIEPFTRIVNDDELFSKCSSGHCKVTEIILDTP
jgi:hypothetical protein